MKVDFNSLEENHLPNFKGGEKSYDVRMFSDGLNKIMKGHLASGASIGLHTHDTSSEIMFFTKGRGSAIYDNEKITLIAGDVHYCPKGHSHTLINDSDEELEFWAVVAGQ